MSEKFKSGLVHAFLLVTFLSLATLACGDGVTPSSRESNGAGENQATAPTLAVSQSASKADANVIIREDRSERDGVAFEILQISRRHDTDTPLQQVIDLEIVLRSTNPGWRGFDVKSSELILDYAMDNRRSALSATPECLLRNDEVCDSRVVYVLPKEVQRVTLFYVSDRDAGAKAPIDVTDPGKRRFIVEINLEAVPFGPTATPTSTSTASRTPSPTTTLTPTPSPIGFATVLNPTVNLRAGPGTNYEVVGNAIQGDELTIYARNEDGSWLLTDWAKQVWIASYLVEIPESVSSIPYAPTFTPTNTPTITPTPSTTPTPDLPSTARAREWANATATIEAFVSSPPVGTWCQVGAERGVCVGDFRYVKCISYSCAPSNGRFIAFVVFVKNLDSSAIHVNPFDVTLVMENGLTYAHASQTYSYWADPMQGVDIAPNNSARGGIVFLVPNDVGPKEVIYSGGWFQADIEIDLTGPPEPED